MFEVTEGWFMYILLFYCLTSNLIRGRYMFFK
jgi:hypothetical protein